MRKFLSLSICLIVLLTLTSCSFFGKKEEKKAKPETSMAMEFVKKAKEGLKKLKEEKEKELKKENKEEEEKPVELNEKDFEAYLKTLDLAVKNMKEQNKELEKKMKDGKLGAMDLLSFSMNAFSNVFNPDAYMDKIAKTEEEREHYDRAFAEIIRLYTYVKDTPVDEFKKKNKKEAEKTQKELDELKKKIEEMKKENPEMAKKMEENFNIVDMEKITKMGNPVYQFSDNNLKLYSKYQKDICAKNNEIKEEINNMKKLFEKMRQN